MFRSPKLRVLGGLRQCRAFGLVAGGRWRRSRLLILCYHGISLDDEHCWSPGLYMSRDCFAGRLEQLRAGQYNVLGLGEAIRRLKAEDLPPKSVVITFDDGLYDFYAQASPLLERYGLPSTVYLTTYYSEYNRPIFRLICDYMLWRKRGATFQPGLVDGTIDLRTPESRAREMQKLDAYGKQNRLSAREKDQLANDLARRIGVDWQEILDKRLLHIMNAHEARQLADRGVDLQLHTHRHLTPRDESLFIRELDDNAARLRAINGEQPRHFCYPSGVHYDQYPRWLRQWGVESAVTCVPGLAGRGNDFMLLPRLCDHSHLTDVEFEGWLCGLLEWFPKRSYHAVDPD